MGFNIYTPECSAECYYSGAPCTNTCNQGVQTYHCELKVYKDYYQYPYPNENQMKLQVFVNYMPIDITDIYPMQDSPHLQEDTNCKSNSGLSLLAKVCESAQKTEEIKTESTIPEQNVPIDYSLKHTKTEDIKQEPDTTIDNTTQEIILVKEPTPEPSTSKEEISKEFGESSVYRKIMTCEHCGKTFTHKGDMNKHLRKHTGEQPFSCPVCDRKFAHTSNLARHLKVHSGDKPFHCERCNKSFSRKDKLVMHQKTRLCLNAGHSSQS